MAVLDKPKESGQKDGSVHAGHRDRKKQQFLRHGLDAFADHEALELLLFYSIPQQDTNPLAHRLIDRFGSLSAVLAAPPEELMQVKGVKASTAVLAFTPLTCISSSGGAANTALRLPKRSMSRWARGLVSCWGME